MKLAVPIRWPAAIAAHGEHVYFMLSESDAVWSVPKAGGAPTVVVPAIATANGGDSCDESLRMWSDARGLFWTRGQRFLGNGVTLYFVPWSALGR